MTKKIWKIDGSSAIREDMMAIDVLSDLHPETAKAAHSLKKEVNQVNL